MLSDERWEILGKARDPMALAHFLQIGLMDAAFGFGCVTARMKSTTGRRINRAGYFAFWNGLGSAVSGIRHWYCIQEGGGIWVNRIIKDFF